MDVCESCGSLMLMGWVACPYCGWQNDMLMNSNRSLVELVQMNSDRESVGGCSGSCSGKKKKKMKSKCCNKHKKKSKKHCKRCPERRASELSASVSSNLGF